MEKSRDETKDEVGVLGELTQLQYAWTVWENWQGPSAKGAEEEKQYLQNMQQIAEFGNLIDFWEVWNGIPHADPGELFYGPQGTQQTLYFLVIMCSVVINQQSVHINGVCVFRSGVHPRWEDALNASGGEFSTTLKQPSKDDIKRKWDKLVIRTIGGIYTHASNVTGLRVVDKFRGGEQNYKFEIWVDEAGTAKAVQDKLAKELAGTLNERVNYYPHSK
jgi:hypothetical protein